LQNLGPGTSVQKLVEASKKTKARFYMPALIFLGAEHGASKQEALSLKWDDIDFDYEGVGIINLFRTKNSRERTEFLMPRTRQALLDWKSHLEFMRHRKKTRVRDTQFVFARMDGTQILRFDNAWRKACELPESTTSISTTFGIPFARTLSCQVQI
jgi:integrase